MKSSPSSSMRALPIRSMRAPTATTPRRTRRVAACERLTSEYAVQRQRAQEEPIVVAWKVERRANGQELISISSEESGSSSNDDASDLDVASAGTNSADESHSDGDIARSDFGDSENSSSDADDDDEDAAFDLRHRTIAAATAGRRNVAKHRARADTRAAPSRKRARNTIVILSDDDDGDDHGGDSDASYSNGATAGNDDIRSAVTLMELAADATSPQQQQQQPNTPVIYAIDSDSDVGGGSSGSERDAVSAPVQQRQRLLLPPIVVAGADTAVATTNATTTPHISSSSAHVCVPCSREAVEGDTTPEASGSSCGDAELRIKRELPTVTVSSACVTSAAAVATVTGPAVVVKAEPIVESALVLSQSPSLPLTHTQTHQLPSEDVDTVTASIKSEREPNAAPIKRELSASASVVPRKVIPLMRRKKLDEEDAAFLLFYGLSEAPTAHILGLIIEYIDRCVGERSASRAHCIKFLLWRTLNAHVDAALTAERLARSEWMKIVFSSSDQSMRYAVDRAPLLPRPVRLTVRPPQYIRIPDAGGGSISSGSVKGEVRAARKQSSSNSSSRTEPAVKTKTASVAAAIALQNEHATSRQRTAPRTPQRSHKRKLSDSAVSVASPQSAAATYSPRKHQRRNGNITVFEGELPTRRASGASPKSAEIIKPLALNQFVAGANQSLPVGYDYEHTGYRTTPCIVVSPLATMSVAQLESHISSVRSEGHMKSSEKLAEVLAKLMADPRNYRGMFNTPVDPVALALPTYTSIVTNPMDLGTVKTRLAEGKYLEVQDFVRDVHLVFENAKLFNAPGHSVHQSADILLRRFDAELKSGLERKRSNSASKHACSACYGHTCLLCEQQCLPLAQPHMQCAGACGADIRKGAIYYVTRDGTRVWCHKCRMRLARDKSATGATAGSADLSFSQSISQSFSQSQMPSQSSNVSAATTSAATTNAAAADAVVRKKCDTGVEPWVKCADCARWLHQSCGLFNPVAGEYATEHTYVCPLCRWRQQASTPPPSSSLHNLLNPTSAERDAREPHSAGLSIPPCELSEFIQSFLRRELAAIGHGAAAATLNVRVLAFPGESMTIPESVVRAFDENAAALAAARPELGAASRLPADVAYLSRGIYLFQQHDGVEVALFSLFAQEFGDDCALAANRRAVYIAYIDSIRYLAPATARTAAYHLIMLAYFDYLRRRGFDRVHIWSCPPQKRISYVFWCRPAFQKTPSAEHLRSWYSRLLARAKDCGIVRDWTTLYDTYLAREDAVLPAATPESEAAHSLIATRGVTARSVDPSELVWPVTELPPIFDGDFVPAELERILGRLSAMNGKVRRASESAAALPSAKNAAVGSSGGKVTLGGEIARIKDEPGTSTGTTTSAASPPSLPPIPPVEFKLREVFSKFQTSVKRMKQDLLVVYLAAVNDNGSSHAIACRPEQSVPAWYNRVPRFFGSRFMFHQLCSFAGYQFDTLRRAKHSTMMMLHHYFNEHLAQVNVFCRDCSLLITHAAYWTCGDCDRFALCDACYRRDGHEHAHELHFGRQVRVHHAPLPLAATDETCSVPPLPLAKTEEVRMSRPSPPSIVEDPSATATATSTALALVPQ